MHRQEAIEQYKNALKLGKKYYMSRVAAGEDPYVSVGSQVSAGRATAGNVELGLIDIPTKLITGTWEEGRRSALAGNFMPLLDLDTEFASKWIELCNAHLGEKGISDPILCYEYLGQFYVREGHKRVSVLKSYGAPLIQGRVTRIIPAREDDPEIALYYEFMEQFRLCGSYAIRCTKPGSYQKLQAALGYAPDHIWTGDERRAFQTLLLRFTACFEKANASEQLPLTSTDALLVVLRIHSFEALRDTTDEELRTILTGLWPDIRLYASGEPVSVSTQPSEAEKSLLSRILSPVLRPRPSIGFVYDRDPETSVWAAQHSQGQAYLTEKLGDRIDISSWQCDNESADAVMEEAIASGVNLLFVTTPVLIDACRRIAALHKNVRIYNCSLSLPYAGVQSYYCRIYEVKFIAGAIAAAMSRTDDIGYIANYPIMGVPAAINAFALGAQMTRPEARVHLKWSCLPGDPVAELLYSGVTVLSNRDAGGVRAKDRWDLGTYYMHPDGTRQLLVSPLWNWGKLYERIVQTVLQGPADATRDDQRAITNWWGLSSGVVDLELAGSLPEGLRFLAEVLKRDIAQERLHPFARRVVDQSGRVVFDGEQAPSPEALLEIDWLNENVTGHIPAFDELQDRSRELVRLLGVYRDSIPPAINVQEERT